MRKTIPLKRYFDANRRRWDESVAVHMRSSTGVYRIDDFRRGVDVLGPIESEELGDLAGKRVLHLQCHFGLDTLCLARRGACVTGLDFSHEAIAAARRLAEECAIDATFVEADVYDAASAIPELFDLVFATWGAINWVPDICRWVQVATELLVPGGSFYLLEGHPAAMALEEREDGRLSPRHAYFQGAEPVMSQEVHTYTGAPDRLQNATAYEWLHPLSAIVDATITSGLDLDFLHEHDRIPWQNFPSMTRDPQLMWSLPPDMPSFPLAFSLRATRTKPLSSRRAPSV
ncbi:MAG: class I SAM-dependent methyltransferase [Polyangiales bacterium]